MKECKICKVEKDDSEFNKNMDKPDGLHIYCKQCHREKSASWAKQNPAKVKAAYALWYKTGRPKTAAEKVDKAYLHAWADGYRAGLADGN